MVDIAAQLGAVDRGITTRDVEGVPSYVQTLGQSYPSPIADVWEAITSADRISRWFAPVDGDLRLGGHYQLQGNAGGDVLACEPPADGAASFRLSWSMDPTTATYVTVRLSSEGDERTRLELEHVAGVDVVPEGMWEQFGPSGTGIGWDSILIGIALYLPDGRMPVDPSTWAATDEGEAFMRGSADAWAAAQIADGADPETAKSGADLTYQMYTGAFPPPL